MLLRYLLLIFVVTHSSLTPADESPVSDTIWRQSTDTGEVIKLWFFWSEKCPHCRDAHPHITKLPEQLPWLRLESYRLDGHPENVSLYRHMAGMIGQEARSVPAFIYCGQMLAGWDDEGLVKQTIIQGLKRCRASIIEPPPVQTQTISLPLLGEINPASLPLTVFTVIIAGLDSFNPCAFFVLMFLLSLLVHAGSKTNMFIIGGFFIFISGLVYFASMVAWLNLFGIIGHLTLVTFLAGLLAITIAVFNIKDYFLFRKGVSLSISDSNRNKLMRRIRAMLSASSLPAMLAATFTLAVFANLYELLCTAGFPMVYTRFLTLNELSTAEYYLYILLYNLIYILPLTLIMIFFVATFGQRKLQENEGRVLKLLSGLMMLALGVVLVTNPELLNHVGFAIVLLTGVILTTWLIVKLHPDRE